MSSQFQIPNGLAQRGAATSCARCKRASPAADRTSVHTGPGDPSRGTPHGRHDDWCDLIAFAAPGEVFHGWPAAPFRGARGRRASPRCATIQKNHRTSEGRNQRPPPDAVNIGGAVRPSRGAGCLRKDFVVACVQLVFKASFDQLIRFYGFQPRGLARPTCDSHIRSARFTDPARDTAHTR